MELARTPGTLRLELHGLGAAPLAELGRRRTGQNLTPGPSSRCSRAPSGNPLFVEELLDEEDGIPMLLHDLLLRHVDRLPAVPRRLARLASVGGTVVDVDVLQDASDAKRRRVRRGDAGAAGRERSRAPRRCLLLPSRPAA